MLWFFQQRVQSSQPQLPVCSFVCLSLSICHFFILSLPQKVYPGSHTECSSSSLQCPHHNTQHSEHLYHAPLRGGHAQEARLCEDHVCTMVLHRGLSAASWAALGEHPAHSQRSLIENTFFTKVPMTQMNVPQLHCSRNAEPDLDRAETKTHIPKGAGD